MSTASRYCLGTARWKRKKICSNTFYSCSLLLLFAALIPPPFTMATGGKNGNSNIAIQEFDSSTDDFDEWSDRLEIAVQLASNELDCSFTLPIRTQLLSFHSV